MISIIQLEAIGDNYTSFNKVAGIKMLRSGLNEKQREMLLTPPRKPWIARITGQDAQFGLQREFLRPKKDYRDSNGTGSRRVMLHFVLHDGVYEVNELLSWKNSRRYFVHADNGKTAEITREEVDLWLARTAK